MRITIYWATKDGGLIDRLRQRSAFPLASA